MGHFKTGLAAAFAIMFGVVQLLCACMDIPNAEPLSPQSHASHTMTMGGHDHAAMTKMAERVPASHDHGEHQHKADCSHCDDTAFILAASAIAPIVLTSPTFPKAAYIDSSPIAVTLIDVANLTGRRWLDPPGPASNPTPVALHTRSLI